MVSLASIPSPSRGTIDLGPLTIHMYGLTLLAAIAFCIWITGTRFVNRGGDWDTIFRCAVWGVGAGIVGARLYHLATSWNEVPDQWWGPFAIWKGGLGIWGGVAAGCLVGGQVAKRSGADVWLLADSLAPGLLVAQAVGRIGNWWNQELFGKPTNLPWGLEIDPAHRPLSSLDRATYHPTFLYELLWDLFAAALLVWVIERRFHPRPPGIFALYIALYSFGRFWVELIRIDPANHILGLRVNTWVSGLVCAAGVVWFWLSQRRGGPSVPRGLRRSAQPPAGPKMAVPKSRVRSGGQIPTVASAVRDLELDLDAFEGPFDLLLTLLLKDAIQPAEIDMAGIVVAFVERLAERDELDLDACGEFLVLIAALLELKARHLFPDEEAELSELEPEEAAEELARRLAEYRRMKLAAVWLRERLEEGREHYFRLGPAPLAPEPERRLAAQEPLRLVDALRSLAVEPPHVSLSHLALRFPPVAQFVERFRAVLLRRRRFDFDTEVQGLSRVEQAVAFLALLELRKEGEIDLSQAGPFAPIRIARASHARLGEAPVEHDLERMSPWTARSA